MSKIKQLFDENVIDNSLVKKVEKNLEHVREIAEQAFANFDIGHRFEPTKGNMDEKFGYDVWAGRGNNKLYFRVSSNGINFNNSIYRKSTDKKLILDVIEFCNKNFNRLP